MKTKKIKRTFLNAPEHGIAYVKELKGLDGIKSTNACVLMQYLEKRFHESPDGFHIQREPVRNDVRETPFTEDRRNLAEELGLTGYEVDVAIKQLGIAYTKKGAFYDARDEGDIFKGKYYCVHRRKSLSGRNGLFFYRNHEKVEEAIRTIQAGRAEGNG